MLRDRTGIGRLRSATTWAFLAPSAALALTSALFGAPASGQSDVVRFRDLVPFLVAVLDVTVVDQSGSASARTALGRAIASRFDEPLLQVRRFIFLKHRALMRAFHERSQAEERLTVEGSRPFAEVSGTHEPQPWREPEGPPCA